MNKKFRLLIAFQLPRRWKKKKEPAERIPDMRLKVEIEPMASVLYYSLLWYIGPPCRGSHQLLVFFFVVANATRTWWRMIIDTSFRHYVAWYKHDKRFVVFILDCTSGPASERGRLSLYIECWFAPNFVRLTGSKNDCLSWWSRWRAKTLGLGTRQPRAQSLAISVVNGCRVAGSWRKKPPSHCCMWL